jgi:hypothetical protein
LNIHKPPYPPFKHSLANNFWKLFQKFGKGRLGVAATIYDILNEGGSEVKKGGQRLTF